MDILSGCLESVGLWLQEHRTAIEIGALFAIGMLVICAFLNWRSRRRIWREIHNLRTDVLADLHTLYSRLDKIENVEFRARRMIKTFESRSGKVLDALDGHRTQQASGEERSEAP